MMRKVLLMCLVMLAAVGSASALEANATSGDLESKVQQSDFQTKMQALRGVRDAIQSQIDDGRALLEKMATCQNKTRFYDPENPKADADGCIRGLLKTATETITLTPRAAVCRGGCNGRCSRTYDLTQAGIQPGQFEEMHIRPRRRTDHGWHNWRLYRLSGERTNRTYRRYGGGKHYWDEFTYYKETNTLRYRAGSGGWGGCYGWDIYPYQIVIFKKVFEKEQ